MAIFIFMLTHDDVTVPNAIEVFDEVKDTGIASIGFKDVGLPPEDMRHLIDAVHAGGGQTFFEAVNLTEEGCMESVHTAINLGVHYFIGGIFLTPALKLLRRNGIKYFPYVGRVIDHPCLLRGSIDEVVRDARTAAASGVDGVNLLAYRYNGDVDRLMYSVKSAVDVPMIVAGDVNSVERVKRVIRVGAWGFTIGSAVFEWRFSTKRSLVDQLTTVMAVVEETTRG